MKRLSLLLLLGCCICTDGKAQTTDAACAVTDARTPLCADLYITDFGATTDSSVVCTAAINAAIDSCARQGGGRVVVPAGSYCTGSVVLKDHVELHLSAGACLYAAADDRHFPTFAPTGYRSNKGASGWTSLIYAAEAHNISITGQGTIDGRGQGRKGRFGGTAGDSNGRPRNLLFISCSDVVIEGIHLRNSALWNQHYLDCEDVVVEGIHVYNHSNSNNDGIDIDGCRRFLLTRSVIDSDDDGIVLKSTGSAPCEDIVVSQCVVSSFANAIKCGTESCAGFRRILITDCVIKPSRHAGPRILKSTPSGISAVSLEVVDGGTMEGVTVSNIIVEGTECPLYIRLANRGRKISPEDPTPSVGRMRHIRIHDITAYGCGNFGASITGIEGAYIEDVRLSGLNFYNRGGLTAGHYRDIHAPSAHRHDTAPTQEFDRYLASYREIIEDADGYPQPTVWGNLPVYGLLIRHARNIDIRDCQFRSDRPDPRPALMAIDVDRLSLTDIETNGTTKADVLLHDARNVKQNAGLKIKVEK